MTYELDEQKEKAAQQHSVSRACGLLRVVVAFQTNTFFQCSSEASEGGNHQKAGRFAWRSIS